MVVLVVNCGSSSLKYILYDMGTETVAATGLIERIGGAGDQRAVVHHRPTDKERIDYESDIDDHYAAVQETVKLLTAGEGKVLSDLDDIDAVGHRVVHGGEAFCSAVLIDEPVIKAIEACASLAPLHNPPNLLGIRACMAALPGKPQVAVFDTAFHQTMPRRAYLYALPYELYERHGIRRYGFHGTSHYYVARRAAELLTQMGRDGAHARVVTCHLGNGCSMSAVADGVCVDTSMGMTPLEGLVMGTRSGDVDPAIIPFLEAKLGKTGAEVERMLNRESGLLGLSGTSNDMRDVSEAARNGHEGARAAVDVFCYRIRKYIGAYAAAMGGLDAVVFTAGIGENSPELRERILTGLSFLGLDVDPERNRTGRGDRAITSSESRAAAFVIRTQEELVIARETLEACKQAVAVG